MKKRKKRLNPRKTPTQKRSMETVSCILKATTRLLEKDGLLALSTNRVAHEAGVSIGSLYQYFPSKEALLSALVREKLTQDRSYFEQALRGFESWSIEEQISRLINSGIELHRRDQKILKVMFEQLGASGQLDQIRELHLELFKMLRKILSAHPKLQGAPELIKYKAYLYQQIILGVWHSQVETSWQSLDPRKISKMTSQLIFSDLS